MDSLNYLFMKMKCVLAENKTPLTKDLCPKCGGNDVVFEGNWTGVMVSDIHAEHFWLAKCKSCGFIFKPSTDKQKPEQIDDKRNHA